MKVVSCLKVMKIQKENFEFQQAYTLNWGHFCPLLDSDKSRHKIWMQIGSTNCLKSIDYKNTLDFEISLWNVGEISNSKSIVWLQTPCIWTNFTVDLHSSKCKSNTKLLTLTYVDITRFCVGFAFRRMQIHFENGSNTYRSYLHWLM